MRNCHRSFFDCLLTSLVTFFCCLGFRYAFNCLRKYLPEETINEVRRMNLTVDGMGAVFDVPSRTVDEFIAGKVVNYVVGTSFTEVLIFLMYYS